MNTNSFLFKGLSILHVVKPRLKNSYISIAQNADITLKTPKVSQAYIDELLQEKELWIRKKIAHIKQYPPVHVNIEDEVLLFGELYSIDMPEASLLRDKLQNIRNNSSKNIQACYNTFYKEYAEEFISPRVEYFSQKMSLGYECIKYRKMKSRWGSCSSRKILTFNTELIKTKKELIDYVVVHELAHLKHMNHSKKFHDLVEEYLPNSKAYRKELKNIKISTS